MQVSRHSTIAFEDKTKHCAQSMSRDDPTQPPWCLLCQSPLKFAGLPNHFIPFIRFPLSFIVYICVSSFLYFPGNTIAYSSLLYFMFALMLSLFNSLV
jgi:hypothetical protein